MADSAAQDEPPAGQITLRYWASARAATGTAQEQIDAVAPLTLAALVEEVIARHQDAAVGQTRLAEVLQSCSVLLGDRQVGNQDPASVLVEAGQTVEFLPPFAGG